ncbi:hypothetical protein D3C72_1539860 [compost metagenome]
MNGNFQNGNGCRAGMSGPPVLRDRMTFLKVGASRISQIWSNGIAITSRFSPGV